MRLVNREVIDAHFLEGQQPVALAVAHLRKPLFQLLDQPLGIGHAHRLAPAAKTRLFRGFLRFIHCLVGDAQLFVQVALFSGRVDVDEAERTVPDDHHVVVARSNAREQAAAARLLEVFLACGKHVGARIELFHVGRPLLDQVVRNDDHRLLRQAHSTALHGAGDGREGLASPDRVVVQHRGVGNSAPNGIELPGAHLDNLVRHLSRQGQERSVALAHHARVEFLVEDFNQTVAPRIVGKGPIQKLVGDLGCLHLRLERRLFIHPGLAVGVLVDHLHRLGIQRALDNLARTQGALARRPLGFRGACGDDAERVGGGQVGHDAAAEPKVLEEVGIHFGRHPSATEVGRDLRRVPRLRLHALQRGHVLLQPGRFRGQQLAAHQAGQVAVRGLPAIRLGVEECARRVAFGQRRSGALFVGAKQLRHALDVDAARLGQNHRHRLACVAHALNGLGRHGHATRKNGRTAHRTVLGHVFDGQGERAVRHGHCNLDGPGLVQRTVLLREAVVGGIQAFAVICDHRGRRIARFQHQLTLERISHRKHVRDDGDTIGAPLIPRRDLFQAIVGDDGLFVEVRRRPILLELLHGLAVGARHIFLALPLPIGAQRVRLAERRLGCERDLVQDGLAALLEVVHFDNHLQRAIRRAANRTRLGARHCKAHPGCHLLELRHGALCNAIDGLTLRQPVNGFAQALREGARVVQANVQVGAGVHRARSVHRADHHRRVLQEVRVDADGFTAAGEVLLPARRHPAAHFRDDAFDRGDLGGRKVLEDGSSLAIPLTQDARRCNGMVHFKDSALAEEQDVRHNIGSGVLLECGVGQAHGTNELGAHGHVYAAGLILRVHQVVRDDHAHQAIRLERLDRLQEELIVNALSVERRVVAEVQRLLAEWRVADRQRELVVRQRDVLESGVQDGLIRVKLLRDAGGEAVILGGQKLGVAAHVRGHQPKEIASADRRLEHCAAAETKALDALPDCLHNGLACEVRSSDRVACRAELGRRQERLKLGNARLPALCDALVSPCAGNAECVFQPTPAHVAR